MPRRDRERPHVLRVVVHPLDAGMVEPMADNLRAIVREIGAMGVGRTEREAMALAWRCLQKPAWWRLEACWHGRAGSFSSQAARDVQVRYLRWRRQESLLGDGLAEGVGTRREADGWWR